MRYTDRVLPIQRANAFATSRLADQTSLPRSRFRVTLKLLKLARRQASCSRVQALRQLGNRALDPGSAFTSRAAEVMVELAIARGGPQISIETKPSASSTVR